MARKDLFERGGFLGFGHLPLLAFLHQRTGGIQRVVGDFVLLPGRPLLERRLLVDDGKSSAHWGAIRKLTPDLAAGRLALESEAPISPATMLCLTL